MTSTKIREHRLPEVANLKPRTVIAVAAAGLFFQVVGVLDGLFVYLIGVDFGINGAFWYRFLCNSAGLVAIGTAMILIAPRSWRIAVAFAFMVLTTYLVFSPGYYRVLDGPLYEHRVTPIEIIRNPYEPPKLDPKRAPGDKSGPELA